MIDLPSRILYFFGLAMLVSFAYPFVRDRVHTKLSFHFDKHALTAFGCVIGIASVVAAAGCILKVLSWYELRDFLLGACVPFMLSRVGLPGRLLSVLLLCMGLAFTFFASGLPGQASVGACLVGVTIWKLSDNLLVSAKSTLDDALPVFIWLVSYLWVTAVGPQGLAGERLGLILGGLSVAFVMQMVQRPLLKEDRLYMKRLILAATSGLVLLIVINKVLLAPDVGKPAYLLGPEALQSYLYMGGLTTLFAAGIVFAYWLFAVEHQGQVQLFEDNGSPDDYHVAAADGVRALVVLGIFSLIATRIWGTFGLVALAPCVLISPGSSLASVAGLYFISRAFLQYFMFLYIPNLSGINITHTYASAGLYAGVLLAILASLVLAESGRKGMAAAVCLAVGGLAPWVSNYFLHEEPTGSFLVSFIVGAVLLGFMAPAMYKNRVPGHANIMLLPLYLVGMSAVGHALLPMGNQAVQSDKLLILAGAAGLVILIMIAGLIRGKWSGAKTVEVTGD